MLKPCFELPPMVLSNIEMLIHNWVSWFWKIKQFPVLKSKCTLDLSHAHMGNSTVTDVTRKDFYNFVFIVVM